MQQLDFDLMDGSFQLSNLEIDVAAVNEVLGASNVECVSGRVGRIYGKIPYTVRRICVIDEYSNLIEMV